MNGECKMFKKSKILLGTVLLSCVFGGASSVSAMMINTETRSSARVPMSAKLLGMSDNLPKQLIRCIQRDDDIEANFQKDEEANSPRVGWSIKFHNRTNGSDIEPVKVRFLKEMFPDTNYEEGLNSLVKNRKIYLTKRQNSDVLEIYLVKSWFCPAPEIMLNFMNKGYYYEKGLI